MRIKAVLWSRPQSLGEHDIKIYASHEGKKIYKTTGIKIKPEYWDAAKAEVKRHHPLAHKINPLIKRMAHEIEASLLDGASIQDLRKGSDNSSLVGFLATIIQEIKTGKIDLAKGTIKKYNSLYTRLKQFCEHTSRKDISFEDVNLALYQELRDFLIDHCNCTLHGGFNKHIQALKRIMNIAKERGLHNNTAYQDTAFRRYRNRPGMKIYLTESEVQRIQELDLSQLPYLEASRDLWIAAYYLLLRFSDVQRISREKFVQIAGRTYYRAHAQKTKEESAVPVKPLVLTLLEKYDYSFAWAHNGEVNKHLKKIAAMAGLTQIVEQEGITAPKWHFVTMHTSRRSIATNLKLQGISIMVIANLGGWKDIRSLQAYLKNSALEAAQTVQDNPIFS